MSTLFSYLTALSMKWNTLYSVGATYIIHDEKRNCPYSLLLKNYHSNCVQVFRVFRVPVWLIEQHPANAHIVVCTQTQWHIQRLPLHKHTHKHFNKALKYVNIMIGQGQRLYDAAAAHTRDDTWDEAGMKAQRPRFRKPRSWLCTWWIGCVNVTLIDACKHLYYHILVCWYALCTDTNSTTTHTHIHIHSPSRHIQRQRHRHRHRRRSPGFPVIVRVLYVDNIQCVWSLARSFARASLFLTTIDWWGASTTPIDGDANG